MIPNDRKQQTSQWIPIHEFNFAHNGQNLALFLDSVSPYRISKGVSLPTRLSSQTLASWNTALNGAWTLLTEYHQYHAQQLAQGLVSLVPVPRTNPFQLTSATSSDAFGQAEIGFESDPALLAGMLIHEFNHSKLNALLEISALDIEDRREIFESPWRSDPRPLRGLLHGAYSFLDLTDFWHHQRWIAKGPQAELAHFEFALCREQTQDAINTLLEQDRLTDIGRQFVLLMSERAKKWKTKPIPERLTANVARTLADHSLTWRLRNLEVDSQFIDKVVTSWPKNLDTQVEVNSFVAAKERQIPPTLRARKHLTQLQLGNPELMNKITVSLVHNVVPSATPADFYLIANKNDLAAKEYQEEIRRDPHNVSAWTGLVLASIAKRDGANDVLHTRPELARSCYLALLDAGNRELDPTDVIAWLNTNLTLI